MPRGAHTGTFNPPVAGDVPELCLVPGRKYSVTFISAVTGREKTLDATFIGAEQDPWYKDSPSQILQFKTSYTLSVQRWALVSAVPIGSEEDK